MYGCYTLAIVLVFSLARILPAVLAILILKYLKEFENGNKNPYLMGLMAAIFFLEIPLHSWGFFHAHIFGLKLRKALAALMFRKMLRLA